METKGLLKYCVCCEKTWGPNLKECCTPTSLVLIKPQGRGPRNAAYFDLDGRMLEPEELARLKQEETRKRDEMERAKLAAQKHDTPANSGQEHDSPKERAIAAENERTLDRDIGSTKFSVLYCVLYVLVPFAYYILLPIMKGKRIGIKALFSKEMMLPIALFPSGLSAYFDPKYFSKIFMWGTLAGYALYVGMFAYGGSDKGRNYRTLILMILFILLLINIRGCHLQSDHFNRQF